MDNKTPDNFWTDALVMEIIGLTHRAGYHKEPARVYDRIQEFKKSKEHKVEEKRIEVIVVDNHRNDNQEGYWYQFITNKEVWFDKFPEIKNLLERYLNGEMDKPAPSANNDTVVEVDVKNWGVFSAPPLIKMYSQSEVDAIRKEAFCSGFFKGWYNGCFEEDKTYSKRIGKARYEAWLSSLKTSNNEPLSDSIPTLERQEKYGGDNKGFHAGDAVTFNGVVWDTDKLGTKPIKIQGKIHSCLNFKSTATVQYFSPDDGQLTYKELPFSEIEPLTENKPQESKQDSKGWEVEHIILLGRDYRLQKDGFYNTSIFSNQYTYNYLLENGGVIRSVRRLSDGEVFSVGDEIDGPIETQNKIHGFMPFCDGKFIVYLDKDKWLAYTLNEIKKLPLTEQPKPKQMWNKHTGVHDESVLCTGMKCQEYNPINKENKYI